MEAIQSLQDFNRFCAHMRPYVLVTRLYESYNMYLLRLFVGRRNQCSKPGASIHKDAHTYAARTLGGGGGKAHGHSRLRHLPPQAGGAEC